MKHDFLKAYRYLDAGEIEAHLEGVEYIILAQPHASSESKMPMHFTLFLNTHDELPEAIKAAVLQKFCAQYAITKTAEVLSALQAVAFAETDGEKIMPMHLFKPEDHANVPHTFLHIIDFLGDAEGFKEVKVEGQTGWSYSYN